MQNNIGAFLSKRAYLSPDADAYVDGASGARLSFRALNARCNRLAKAVCRCVVNDAVVSEGELMFTFIDK